MARRKPSPARLAASLAELALAAPAVVAHRTTRMAAAGLAPSRRDREEFLRMGSEKVAAFYQSWWAMYAQAFAAQWQLAQAMSTGAFGASQALQEAMLSTVSAGLAPVHRKAVSNAKRLGRSKRR
jgi:hypothetical protein